MGMNVVGYCRVSTKNQIGEDKYGIEAQRRDIERYCAEKGHNIVGWYVDEAVSGAKDEDERPELRRLLNGEIKNPPIGAVVVAKNDRLAQDIQRYYGFKYLLKRMGIDVISVSEDFDSAGVFAPLYEALTAVFAQMEREYITKRMTGGRTAKAAKGGHAGGALPYGYGLQQKRGILTINEEEAKMVRLVYHLYFVDFCSLHQTAEALNREGFKSRSGNKFTFSSIQEILKKEKFYRGWYKYGKDGKWVKGQHQPILTDADKGSAKVKEEIEVLQAEQERMLAFRSPVSMV